MVLAVIVFKESQGVANAATAGKRVVVLVAALDTRCKGERAGIRVAAKPRVASAADSREAAMAYQPALGVREGRGRAQPHLGQARLPRAPSQGLLSPPRPSLGTLSPSPLSFLVGIPATAATTTATTAATTAATTTAALASRVPRGLECLRERREIVRAAAPVREGVQRGAELGQRRAAVGRGRAACVCRHLRRRIRACACVYLSVGVQREGEAAMGRTMYKKRMTCA